MLGFTTDELIWAINRDRADEARRVRPHTEMRQPEKEIAPHAVEESAHYPGLGRGRRRPLGA